MKYRVITYNPYKICHFKTIKDAKNYMNDCGYRLNIDKKTISRQITDGNTPEIRYERIQIN
jgi:hypothetical protein